VDSEAAIKDAVLCAMACATRDEQIRVIEKVIASREHVAEDEMRAWGQCA